MSQIVIADLLLRGASIGIFALLLARLLTRKPLWFAELAFAALVASLIVYVVVSSPTPLVPGGAVGTGLSYMPILAPFFLWWPVWRFLTTNLAPDHGISSLPL